ncbi:hypothetical protein CAPTEDRAFT_181941 [Capitella teleta]|uniref:Calcipressin n=1 Tax=Capitella teleta TaxID=283909 RepID=R7UVW2_CAPTE|nr:hypothetical protein CAPTEDRAFT_181941 [Capitella teleta]|eukprot:ELU08057.1 hypothetical protein CAPTEDRAFT_181941 [Capitella teleta]
MEGVTDGIRDIDLTNEITLSQLKDLTGLPNALIVTNVADAIFSDAQAKVEFERSFMEYDANADISYLKSFRRARIIFTSPITAAKARIHLDGTSHFDKQIRCYFAQPLDDDNMESSPNLELPAPHRQFLISPPASPPVGWEPVPEAEPVINYDLLAALANLAPGEAHEVHPPSDKHPGIVVHICEDPVGYATRPKLQQTTCPVRKS